jgi:hypothetical protein
VAVLGVVALTSVAFGNCEFCGLGCGGGGGGGAGSFTVEKDFDKTKWHGDGIYGTDITMTGHFDWSNGVRQVFPLNVATIKLGEMCMPPDAEWQWDYNQQRNYALYGSPYSTEIAGGYATPSWMKPIVCWDPITGGGQALWWEWSWHWLASSPQEVDDGGFARDCVVLSGFGGNGPPLYGLC